MEKKEPDRSRKVQIKLYVSEEEKKVIRQRMEEAGIENFSRYARLMLFYGHINKVDVNEIREARLALNRIGTNLNQIAKRVNENGEAGADDMGQALLVMKEVKQTLNEILLSKIEEDDSVKNEYRGVHNRQSVTANTILIEQLGEQTDP